jgi:uncharacterized protein (DUF2141 family)
MKIILFSILFSLQAIAAPVTLRFSEVIGNGQIMVAIFDDPGQFPDKTPFQTKILPIKNQTNAVLNLDLPEGDYAISVFLDENNNQKLDTNVLGIPKERFGFSNNPRILTGPPTYQQCEVRVGSAAKELNIKLIKLFNR